MAGLAVAGALVSVELVLIKLERRSSSSSSPRYVKEDDIARMKSWLDSMNTFIENNDGREEAGSTLEDHLKKVRSVAYDIEDVLDEFLLHSSPYLFHTLEISRKAHRMAHNVKHQFPLDRISNKIAGIMSAIDVIKSQLDTFPSSSSGTWQSPSSSNSKFLHQVNPLLRDQEMVGYETPKKGFIDLLVEERETRLVRIAVVGPGGSGKTAFVKNVYWKKEIRARFDCHAWVHVGRHFYAGDLFVNLLKQLEMRKDSYPNPLDHHEMLEKLQRYLNQKRYLIVLDDIWKKEHWDIIKVAFPDAAHGSKIVVTTGLSLDAATPIASSRGHVFDLRGLEWPEGWKLFCRKAFPEINGECPAELKDCSVKIVKRCEGLPLAIVAVGSALAHKPKHPHEWDRFHNTLGIGPEAWQYDSSLKVLYNALLPSYMDLPRNLKSCFLYFSMFPEDYSIQRGRLIRLWVAERFAKGTSIATAEEVAETYLDELICRNLVDVSDYDFDGNHPRSFRVRNLFLKLIVQKCEDENFASIFNQEHASCSQKIRRLSVHHDSTDQLPPNSNINGVRSMFLLRLLGKSPSDFNTHVGKMQLLKVLDFQAAPITRFPKAITNLILIKYLSFRGTKIRTIPSSIKKLCYLETLDLKQTDVMELPEEISLLYNLCHLFAYKYNVQNYVVFDSVQGVKIPNSIGKMTNLQDLSLVKVDKKGIILKELKDLRRLRKLGLVGLKREHGSDLCSAIEEKPKLRTLDLCTSTKQEYLELGEVKKNPPQFLQRLYLKGLLREFPDWISSLNNLFRIALKWSRLNHSPLMALERLPNLLELQLIDCYTGQELTFKVSSFRKLKVLLIEELSALNTIVIQDGAMSGLKRLSLRKCPQLNMFPLGMEKLEQIEELTLYDMPRELIARIGEYRETIGCNNPAISCFKLNPQSESFETVSHDPTSY